MCSDLIDLPKMDEATKRTIFSRFAGHWAITPRVSQHHFQSFPTLVAARIAPVLTSACYILATCARRFSSCESGLPRKRGTLYSPMTFHRALLLSQILKMLSFTLCSPMRLLTTANEHGLTLLVLVPGLKTFFGLPKARIVTYGYDAYFLRPRQFVRSTPGGNWVDMAYRGSRKLSHIDLSPLPSTMHFLSASTLHDMRALMTSRGGYIVEQSSAGIILLSP